MSRSSVTLRSSAFNFILLARQSLMLAAVAAVLADPVMHAFNSNPKPLATSAAM